MWLASLKNCAHPRQRGRDRQEPARHLARRAPVCPQAGAGRVRLLRHPVAECDAQIEAQLQRPAHREVEPAKGKKRSKARNAPKFDLRTRLFQMCGVDLTRIDGIDVTTALVVVSEDRHRHERSRATSTSRPGWVCVRAPRSPAARS
jgi:hypothetical protein